METATQARIDDYLEVYERANSVVKSAEITSAIIEQIGKDTRCEWLMNGRSNGNGRPNGHGNGDQAATEKQLGFLKKLKVEVPAGLSKGEASRLIDEAQIKSA